LQTAAPPDATHQGGWPSGTDYFYFPKDHLKNASFHVLSDQRVSDEAAALYNLTESERQEVDSAIGELFAQFRAPKASSCRRSKYRSNGPTANSAPGSPITFRALLPKWPPGAKISNNS
jgi:hypothetical protein